MSDRWLPGTLPADPYPEGEEGLRDGSLDRYGRALWNFVRRRRRAGSRCRQRLLAGIAGHRAAFATLVPEELLAAAQEMGRDLRREGLGQNAGARALAFLARVIELAGEGVADEADLAAAWVILCGAVAELPSAASPRRALALAACAGALGGRAVHVLGPDEQWARQALAGLEPACRLLGITLGGLFHGDEPGRRRAAERCTIVVAAARELAFEYLRDRLRAGTDEGSVRLRLRRLDPHAAARNLGLRGVDLAIVGEADATLLDGASAPIAVTDAGRLPSSETLAAALQMAALLVPQVDYTCDTASATVMLTPAGKARLPVLALGGGSELPEAGGSEALVALALRALHLCVRERDYRIVADRVLLVDGLGRGACAEAAGNGALRRMLAVKEGVQPADDGEVLAKLAMQRFFRRYRTLGGLGATVREAAPEMRQVFSLPVVAVGEGAVRRPVVTRVLTTAAEKWEAVGDRLAVGEAAGETVLVGVGSPAEATALGAVLEKRSIAWRYLDGPQSLAAPGPAAVALPAAWRSSFLPPSGNFRVLLADGQPGGRLDRQLARWAEGGNCEAILSLEDPVVARLFATVPPSWWRHAGEAGWLRRWAYRVAQRWTARENARLRQKLLQYDMQMKNMLAFAGRGE